MRGQVVRIGRAASGKVQFEFTDRLGFIFSQISKGEFAVNGATLAEFGGAVKFEFSPERGCVTDQPQRVKCSATVKLFQAPRAGEDAAADPVHKTQPTEIFLCAFRLGGCYTLKNMTPDSELLATFARTNSEDAFAELVKRHVNLVYSAALRQVNGDEHFAKDVAQAVFTDLARKAGSLARRENLTGWLYTSAHFAAAKIVRTEARRRQREGKFMREPVHESVSNAASEAEWQNLRSSLDAAMHELKETDREAILLRYFENRPFAEVGAKLGLNENSARMRVERAVEKLRGVFTKRGIATTSVLTAAITANAVQAAPVGLAVTLSAAALAGTAATTSTLIAATTKTIAMTTLQKTLVTATVAVLAGAGLYEARQASTLRDQVQTLQQQQAPLVEQIQELQRELNTVSNRNAGLTEDLANAKENNVELLKLRGETGVLKQTVTSLSNQVARASNPYGLSPEQMPPIVSSGVPDTAKAYARLAMKKSQKQLSAAEEFNLLKAWPYLEKRFSEPDSFAYFQSEYLATMFNITNKNKIWEIRRLIESAREEEHAYGLRWARESDDGLRRYKNLNIDVQKIREQWNTINQKTTEQILELFSEDQQITLASKSLQILDFDPQLKSDATASLNEPRFQNLNPQDIFRAFFPPNPNVRFVPATPVEKD
jgi:RNA polymerase sigma factor (sigma-70 family)